MTNIYNIVKTKSFDKELLLMLKVLNQYNVNVFEIDRSPDIYIQGCLINIIIKELVMYSP